MNRTTIDFGIDLGTTNSSVAVLKGTESEIILNNRGASFTPSAVWIDKKGQIHVGDQAKQRVESDPDNAKAEFKLRMGQGEKCKETFVRSGQEMLPEELSAEVLKSLKADVRQNKGEDIHAAVITLPAAFEIDQCDATRKAAELAGFTQSLLLQEPVAAASAYGFQDSSDKVFWMVYDFGGGTFDAAVIQVRDGIIQVVNHAGDNYLGGQRIDWDIVEKKLIPKLTKQYKLTDFRRGNKKWCPAIAKLKGVAESAKIEVCHKQEPSVIWVEDLCKDEGGQTVDFEYELTPGELKKIITPYVTRTLNLCKQALEEESLSGENIEKVLMVGGTTLIPWLRNKVKKELGAPLEFSIDPITVVARGAAIFAGGKWIKGIKIEVPADSFEIKLEYDPIGNETEPEIGGRIIHPEEDASMEGYTVEFVENKSQWRSGKIAINENGAFITEVHAERGRKCEFLIELCDPTGTLQKTVPDQFGYTVGKVMTNPPITHNLGVAMANNVPFFFFEKGDSLPARGHSVFHTISVMRKGQKGELIRIPVIEGENKARADRNDLLGSLEIKSDNIKRDVPAGSDVEITIYMDESRILTAKAFIPVLDEEFEEVINYKKKTESIPELRKSFELEKERLKETRNKTTQTDSPKAQELLQKIEDEDMLDSIQSLMDASEGDAGAAGEFQNQLTDLKIAIDEVEDAIDWPTLVKEAKAVLEEAKRLVDQYGEPDEKDKLAVMESNVQKGIDSQDTDVLRHYTQEVNTLVWIVLFRQPGYWVGEFERLKKSISNMRDIDLAKQLIAQGDHALRENNIEALEAVVCQLWNLLPVPERPGSGKIDISHIIR